MAYGEVFWMLNTNDLIHWWYVVISVVLLVPMCIGTTFFIVFFGEDNNATRGRLDPACILAICSATLYAFWNLWYFAAYYKGKYVLIGTD